MVFGRKKKTATAEVDPYAHVDSGQYLDDKERESTRGPFDIADAPEDETYLDLGALKLVLVPEASVRLEIEEKSQRVVSATIDLLGSTLQVQVFAAPRLAGIWEDIQEQITESVQDQNGRVEKKQGRFGTELLASLPVVAGSKDRGERVARFIGIDGPRWFLRALIGGAAASEPAEAKTLEDLLAKVVVERGNTPMPPRELLTLKVPGSESSAEVNAVQDPEGTAKGPQPGERGPEITRVG